MPTWSRRNAASASSSRAVMSSPATTTRPDVARSSPATIIIRLDLPAPDGPISPTDSPAATRIVTPRNTWTGPAGPASVSVTASSAMMEGAVSVGMMRRRGRIARNGTAPLLVKWALLLLIAIVSARAAQPTKILVLGDSIGAGYGLRPGESFPARLGAMLNSAGHAVEMLDANVSGDTTADGLARLDDALARHPDLALVELGANDALRGMDPKRAYDNLDAIVTRLDAAHIQVMLLGMRAPGNWGRAYQGGFRRDISPARRET